MLSWVAVGVFGYHRDATYIILSSHLENSTVSVGGKCYREKYSVTEMFSLSILWAKIYHYLIVNSMCSAEKYQYLLNTV